MTFQWVSEEFSRRSSSSVCQRLTHRCLFLWLFRNNEENKHTQVHWNFNNSPHIITTLHSINISWYTTVQSNIRFHMDWTWAWTSSRQTSVNSNFSSPQSCRSQNELKHFSSDLLQSRWFDLYNPHSCGTEHLRTPSRSIRFSSEQHRRTSRSRRDYFKLPMCLKPAVRETCLSRTHWASRSSLSVSEFCSHVTRTHMLEH